MHIVSIQFDEDFFFSSFHKQLTFVSKRSQMFDGKLQNLCFLQFPAMRIPGRCRY